MESEHISVIPNVGGRQAGDHLRGSFSRDTKQPIRTFSAKSVDPDVKKMMESGSDDFNVTKIPHQKTKEEIDAENVKSRSGTSSWVIILMAIVVVILICAIVYLVLKYNETCEPPPRSLLNNLKRKTASVVKIPPAHQQRTTQQSIPQRSARPQLREAKRPIAPPTAPVGDGSSLQPNGRGTKEEMMKILQRTQSDTKLSSVEEEPEHVESNHTKSKKPEQVTSAVESSKEDDEMVSEFYQQMKMNVEDSEEEKED